jgi:hypothetical protein
LTAEFFCLLHIITFSCQIWTPLLITTINKHNNIKQKRQKPFKRYNYTLWWEI